MPHKLFTIHNASPTQLNTTSYPSIAQNCTLLHSYTNYTSIFITSAESKLMPVDIIPKIKILYP